MNVRDLDETRGTPRLPILACLLGLVYLQGATGFQAELIRRGFRWLSTPIRLPLLVAREATQEASSRLAANRDLVARLRDLEQQAHLARLEQRLVEERCQQALRVENLLENYRTATTGVGEAPILARVAGWSSQPHEWRIQLDRGARDGIRLDGPVVHGENLLGRVIEVGPRESRVLLVQDPASALGILLQEDRSPGVAAGTGEPRLRLQNLPPGSRPRHGERVVTGSLSAYFPKGLVVGTVALDEAGSVAVLPAVDPLRIEEVLVLPPAGRREGRATPTPPDP